MATAFPQGTAALFYSNTAPTGWTKVASYTDHALRVLGAGSPATGGSPGNPYSGVFGAPLTRPYTATMTSTASGATTLTSTTYVTHTHTYRLSSSAAPVIGGQISPTSPRITLRNSSPATITTANTGVGGSGGSHSHPTGSVQLTGTTDTSMLLKYVDAIIATKD